MNDFACQEYCDQANPTTECELHNDPMNYSIILVYEF